MNLKLAAFAETFPAEMSGKLDALSSNLLAVAGEKLVSLVSEPVLTGTLRASRTLSTVPRGLRLGWSAPGAGAINVGRVQSKPYTMSLKHGGKSVSFTRTLGSEQAPQGFTRPAIAGLRLGFEQVAEEAGKGF